MMTYKLPGWAQRPRVALRLRVFKDQEELDSIELSDKALLFGRKVPNAPARGTLRLEHDSISREHAAIVHDFTGKTVRKHAASRSADTSCERVSSALP